MLNPAQIAVISLSVALTRKGRWFKYNMATGCAAYSGSLGTFSEAIPYKELASLVAAGMLTAKTDGGKTRYFPTLVGAKAVVNQENERLAVARLAGDAVFAAAIAEPCEGLETEGGEA